MDFFNALFREERLYFDLFDQITDAIYICDTEHRLVYFNKAAETLDGFDLKEVKGKTVEELYGIDAPALRPLQRKKSGTTTNPRKQCIFLFGSSKSKFYQLPYACRTS